MHTVNPELSEEAREAVLAADQSIPEEAVSPVFFELSESELSESAVESVESPLPNTDEDGALIMACPCSLS